MLTKTIMLLTMAAATVANAQGETRATRSLLNPRYTVMFLNTKGCTGGTEPIIDAEGCKAAAAAAVNVPSHSKTKFAEQNDNGWPSGCMDYSVGMGQPYYFWNYASGNNAHRQASNVCSGLPINGIYTKYFVTETGISTCPEGSEPVECNQYSDCEEAAGAFLGKRQGSFLGSSISNNAALPNGCYPQSPEKIDTDFDGGGLACNKGGQNTGQHRVVCRKAATMDLCTCAKFNRAPPAGNPSCYYKADETAIESGCLKVNHKNKKQTDDKIDYDKWGYCDDDELFSVARGGCKEPPTPGPTTSPTPGPTTSPTQDPTQGPTTTSPTPGPTTSPTQDPTQGPTTTSPTSSPTLGPVSVAAAAFDEVVANVSAKHCYNGTDAANVDMKELKSKFASYKKHVRKMTFVDRRALRNDFQKRQFIFAAVKRDLRTLKREAKLNGKKGCDTGSPV